MARSIAAFRSRLRSAILLTIVLLCWGCGDSPLDVEPTGHSPELRNPGLRNPELRNIVLVTFDSLRADHLSSFGYRLDTSPNLDALARESTVFTNVLSQSATTPLSLNSFFFSLYPLSEGQKAYKAGETFATLLGRNGYETAAVIGH